MSPDQTGDDSPAGRAGSESRGDDRTDGSRDVVRRVLGDRDLVVVSNREPYSHGYGDGEVTVSRPAGGLTAALDPVMQSLGGTWVAWGSGDADFAVADREGRVEVPPEDSAYELRRVPLTARQVEEYYLGYSNQVLWPLAHGMPTRATFDDAFWTRYREVNDQFADAVVGEICGRDAVVWFHDYHLALAPRAVRAARPDAFLMQFWHIPWPSWSACQRCPHAADLVEGLLANDLVCFHAKRYVRQFLDCVERCLDADVDRDAAVVHYDGRRTAVRAFPLGIDADEFAALAGGDDADDYWREFADEHSLNEVRVGVGVDRLDYTKGIVERLEALERMWERHPDRRGEFTFVQKGTESRSEIDEYRRVQREVAAQAERVNARFGTDDWTPVVYVTDYLPEAALAGLYRHADVAVVSPLRDGMNLVAKEYVAAQVDGDGVLVLSELAGAAEQLGDDALLVNPNDTEGFADALDAALAMPEAARRRRMRRLRELVTDEDTDAWVRAQFETVAALEAGEDRTGPVPSPGERREHRTPLVWERRGEVRERIAAADGVLACLDFDGTLADIVDDPDDAEHRPEARDALHALVDAPDTRVAVVSGRALADLRQRVGLDLAYAGNHGLELFDGARTEVHPDAADARPAIARVCDRLRRELADVDGVVVEDKRLTATVHYRNVDGDRVDDVVDAVRAAVADEDEIRVTEGKQILELRPAVDWDKGRALEWLRDESLPDGERWLTVYVGDDVTDEDAFEALGDHGIGVKVGSTTEPTAAHCAVADPGEVADFLAWLAGVAVECVESEEESALAEE
jgi:trehalose 6-phosphate synthase